MFSFFKRKPKRLEESDLPEEIRESLMLLEVHVMQGSDPLPLLESVTREYPGYVPARLNLAMFQLSNEGPDAARKAYEAVLRDFPEEPGAIAGLATVEAEAGQLEEAEELAQQALDAGYLWPSCYEVIAKAREARGNLEAAADAYLAGYRLHPHSWNLLQEHCRLVGRSFTPPTETMEPCITPEELHDLASYVDRRAHTPGEGGEAPGCDHTLRFAEEWARKNQVDLLELFQFLNAYGGFCDCEICFNVTQMVEGDAAEVDLE